MAFIPERPQGSAFRTLIVLLDGTGDSVDGDITNIVHLKNMLYGNHKDEDKQMVLYMRGIGSPMDGFDPEFADQKAHSWKSTAYRIWEQAFAGTFGQYIDEPYEWLSRHYRDGDKICIFGFSRGAYTARALVGMIKSLGLLSSEKATSAAANEAFKVYDNFADLSSKANREEAFRDLEKDFEKFKSLYECRKVFIEFLGCWDTVNSVGYVRAIKLGYTRTNDIVRTFRHAISLDEHRVKFKQNNWSSPPKDVPKSVLPKDTIPRNVTDVEEVWFAGCHCDVGGGSVPNGTRPNLAHIPLRWMIRECFKRNSSMIFNSEALKVIGIDPSSLDPSTIDRIRPFPESSSFSPHAAKIAVVQPLGWGEYLASWIPFWSSSKVPTELVVVPNKTEAELEAADALAPAYDQLKLKPRVWAAMEQVLLIKDKVGEDGKWVEAFERHLSRGRTIPPATASYGGKVKVHRSVKMRMEAVFETGPEEGKKYVPLALVAHDKYAGKSPFDKAVEQGWIEWVA